jgi:RNA polymerase sigma-70 factor (ECF subfamily)
MIFTRKKNLHKSEKMLDDEAKLIQLAKEDISQFELLYDKYYEDVVRFVYQRVNTKASAFNFQLLTFKINM